MDEVHEYFALCGLCVTSPCWATIGDFDSKILKTREHFPSNEAATKKGGTFGVCSRERSKDGTPTEAMTRF